MAAVQIQHPGLITQDDPVRPGTLIQPEVELVQMDDGINIRRASSIPHRTLEERLTAFYGKPIDQIDRIEAEELDWGKAEGSEAW